MVANGEGGSLSYTQFKHMWQYIVTRSTKERTYVRHITNFIHKSVDPRTVQYLAGRENSRITIDIIQRLYQTHFVDTLSKGAKIRGISDKLTNWITENTKQKSEW